MSYLETPNWSQDILAGALFSLGAASATAVGLFLVAMLTYAGPAILVTGGPIVLMGFFTGLFFGLVALLLFGAPGTFLLYRMRAESVRSYGLLGAVSGLAATYLILDGFLLAFGFLVDAALAGAVGGVVWWRTYRRHFQDLETASG